MAWECPAQLLLSTKPDFIWQGQDAKPTAAQGGCQPGLLVCTEQLPLVSGLGPACFGRPDWEPRKGPEVLGL